MFDTAYIKRMVRANDKGLFPGLTLADIGKLLIVHNMPVPDSLDRIRITAKAALDHTHQRIQGFHKICRLGQNDNVSLIALLLHESQRYGVRNSSVQELLSSNLHYT